MTLTFHSGDLDSPDVQDLLAFHFDQMRSTSPPEACHVLPIDGLRHPTVTFWTARDGAPLSNRGNIRFWSFSRVETSGGIQASLAGRYASALFDLAREQRQIESVDKSLDILRQALLDSKDSNELVMSPVISRKEAGK